MLSIFKCDRNQFFYGHVQYFSVILIKLNTFSGKMVLTFHAVNSRTLPNMDIEVKMARKMSLGSWTWDMDIPCIAEVGSW